MAIVPGLVLTQERPTKWQRVDCTSAWVIYLCTCKKCGGQYVGKSKTPFKIRHSNHKQEIKNKIGGLGHHYGGSGGCGYPNFSVTIIEEIEHKNFSFLAERETYWQHQLRVYVENGSNGHCYRKEVWVWRSSVSQWNMELYLIDVISFGLSRSYSLCSNLVVRCTWKWTLNVIETSCFAIDVTISNSWLIPFLSLHLYIYIYIYIYKWCFKSI